MSDSTPIGSPFHSAKKTEPTRSSGRMTRAMVGIDRGLVRAQDDEGA